MAHIGKSYETTRRRNGKPVTAYPAHWDEPWLDDNGAPIPGKRRKRQGTRYTKADAEALCDELNAARHGLGGTTALTDARRAAALPFAHYAAGWLAEQRRRHAEGTLKIGTLTNYERLLAVDILPRFGPTAIGAITLVHCEEFRADLAARLNPRSVRNVWWPLTAVFRYAVRARALQSSPGRRRRPRPGGPQGTQQVQATPADPDTGGDARRQDW